MVVIAIRISLVFEPPAVAEVMVEADIFEIDRDLVEVEFVVKRISRIVVQQVVVTEQRPGREWGP